MQICRSEKDQSYTEECKDSHCILGLYTTQLEKATIFQSWNLLELIWNRGQRRYPWWCIGKQHHLLWGFTGHQKSKNTSPTSYKECLLKVLTAGVPKLTELSSVSGIQYGKVPLLFLLFQFSEYISWMHIQYIKTKMWAFCLELVLQTLWRVKK